MDPMTMMLIAQGGAKMAQTGSRLLQPKFQNTRAGQMLRNRSRQGNLSQAQENTIMNRVGANAGRIAEVARNRYAGRMINQGMGGSVAMNRGLREAQDDVRRTQYDTARGIYQNEELAKSKAKMDYAQAMDRDKAERRQAIAGMVGAGLETAGQYFGNKNNQLTANLPKGIDKFLNDYSNDQDPAKLFGRLLESGMNREDAKDLMRYIDSQTKYRPSRGLAKKVDYKSLNQ